MQDVFNKKYAEIYDLIYSKKDYLKESNWIEKIFMRYSDKKPGKILELGCGTGNYTEIFAKKGYEITGVDFSRYMIEIAKRKARLNKLEIPYFRRDIRELNLRKKFDLCLMLFNVVGYLNRDSDIINCFKSVREHLVEGGLFLFDFWFAQAVLNIKPSRRINVLQNGDLTIVKISSPVMKKSVIDIFIKIFISNKNKFVEKFNEKHRARFFSPEEYRGLLKTGGFKIIKETPFLNSKNLLNKKTWIGFVVCKKI